MAERVITSLLDGQFVLFEDDNGFVIKVPFESAQVIRFHRDNLFSETQVRNIMALMALAFCEGREDAITKIEQALQDDTSMTDIISTLLH